MNVDFTFSDTVAGYVVSYNSEDQHFTLKTSDGREQVVHLMPNTYARFSYNLNESYQDATGVAGSLLALPRQFVFAYGSFYPGTASPRFEAQWLEKPGKGPGIYRNELSDWWMNQSRSFGLLFFFCL